MNTSAYAAWYGAAVATLVLLWDVLKWNKRGPRIKAEAYSGWASMGIPELEGHSLTMVKATNVGDRPTTVSSFGMYWYPSGASTKEKEKRQAFIIKPGGICEIPKKLEPGDVWQGLAKEDDEIKKMFEDGAFYAALGFSHTNKEVLVKVIANNAVNKDAKKASLFRRLLP